MVRQLIDQLPDSATLREHAAAEIPVAHCPRFGCTYGQLIIVHTHTRVHRAFLTLCCRSCQYETVVCWLTHREGSWVDHQGRHAGINPASIKLPKPQPLNAARHGQAEPVELENILVSPS